MDPVILEGARRFADANRSDPFAYARAISHYHSGISTLYHWKGGNEPVSGYYDAEPVVIGEKLVGYKNVVRP